MQTVPWKVILYLIIGIFALAFLILIILNVVNKGNAIFPNTPEALELEQAIGCSYWRCVEGCNSPIVRELESETFKCRTEFCKPEFTDTKTPEGKICDENAKAHPVLATVPSGTGLGQVVTKNVLSEMLSKKGEDKNIYISPSGDNCKDLGGGNVAYIDNRNVVKTEAKDLLGGCDVQDVISPMAGGATLCAEKILVGSPQTGSFYIWTGVNILGLPVRNTMVCSVEPGNPSGTDCVSNGGVCRVENCLNNEEQIQGKCPQGRDITKVCCKAKS